MSTATNGARALLLGEWACLGILAAGPAHGFAIAARLKPDGDVGRVWSVPRALVYRALDRLAERGLTRVVGSEPGIAGGERTIVAITAAGRRALAGWLGEPVEHIRDLRSELLLKLVLAGLGGVDPAPMVDAQRAVVAGQLRRIATEARAAPDDLVLQWRRHACRGALAFLDGISSPAGRTRTASAPG